MARDSAENHFSTQNHRRELRRGVRPKTRAPWYAWLAVASISFNLLTLTALVVVRGMISDSLTHANQSLFDTMRNIEQYEGYTVDVQMSEEITLDQSAPVLFQDTITVPISRTVAITKMVVINEEIVVPINTTAPVNTSVPINRVVQAPLDIAGTRVFIDVPINLSVPINLEVPINMEVRVPFESEVPVAFDIPIDFEVDIALNELIPLTDRNGDPLSVSFDAATEITVPVSEIMQDVNLMTTLSDLHGALNVVETVLLLPSPQEASLPAAPDAETAQR